MKKIVLLAFFFLATTLVNAQSLIFCEKVSDDGRPEKASYVFTISKSGGFFDFLVVLNGPCNTTHVKYDLYFVDADGREIFDQSMVQDVEESWMYFWKEMTFYKAGDYTVYVLDDKEQVLCSGMVKVVMK